MHRQIGKLYVFTLVYGGIVGCEIGKGKYNHMIYRNIGCFGFGGAAIYVACHQAYAVNAGRFISNERILCGSRSRASSLEGPVPVSGIPGAKVCKLNAATFIDGCLVGTEISLRGVDHVDIGGFCFSSGTGTVACRQADRIRSGCMVGNGRMLQITGRGCASVESPAPGTRVVCRLIGELDGFARSYRRIIGSKPGNRGFGYVSSVNFNQIDGHVAVISRTGTAANDSPETDLDIILPAPWRQVNNGLFIRIRLRCLLGAVNGPYVIVPVSVIYVDMKRSNSNPVHVVVK